MTIEGNSVRVQKSAKEIFGYFMMLENFGALMPDNVEKFEAEKESFLFQLKGMPEIRLVLKEKIEYSKIVLGSASSQFPFELVINIDEVTADESLVKLEFEGSFNPMVSMMVKRPLKKFIEVLTDSIQNL